MLLFLLKRNGDLNLFCFPAYERKKNMSITENKRIIERRVEEI